MGMSDYKPCLSYPLTNPALKIQRIEPIGYDAKRNAYWLIGGTCKSRLIDDTSRHREQVTGFGSSESHPDQT